MIALGRPPFDPWLPLARSPNRWRSSDAAFLGQGVAMFIEDGAILAGSSTQESSFPRRLRVTGAPA